MAHDGFHSAGARRRGARSFLTLVVVGVAALAGWAVAPTGAAAAPRLTSPAAGAVVKHATPTAGRVVRSAVVGVVTRIAVTPAAAARAAGQTHHGSPSIPLVAALLTATAVGGATFLLRRSPAAGISRAPRPGLVRRGRAPPVAPTTA